MFCIFCSVCFCLLSVAHREICGKDKRIGFIHKLRNVLLHQLDGIGGCFILIIAVYVMDRCPGQMLDQSHCSLNRRAGRHCLGVHGFWSTSDFLGQLVFYVLSDVCLSQIIVFCIQYFVSLMNTCFKDIQPFYGNWFIQISTTGLIKKVQFSFNIYIFFYKL